MRSRRVLFLLAASGLAFMLSGCGNVQQGNWRLARGDYAAAEASFKAAVASDPDDLTARRRLGLVYFDTGRYELAAGEFNLARKDWQSPDVQLMYGLALIGAGRVNEGCQELQGFTHPTLYRITQEVQGSVGASCGDADPQVLRRQLREAWWEGERQEQMDRTDSDSGGGGGIPKLGPTIL